MIFILVVSSTDFLLSPKECNGRKLGKATGKVFSSSITNFCIYYSKALRTAYASLNYTQIKFYFLFILANQKTETKIEKKIILFYSKIFIRRGWFSVPPAIVSGRNSLYHLLQPTEHGNLKRKSCLLFSFLCFSNPIMSCPYSYKINLIIIRTLSCLDLLNSDCIQ